EDAVLIDIAREGPHAGIFTLRLQDETIMRIDPGGISLLTVCGGIEFKRLIVGAASDVVAQLMRSARVLGIDVGIHGALALLVDGAVAEIADMPTVHVRGK